MAKINKKTSDKKPKKKNKDKTQHVEKTIKKNKKGPSPRYFNSQTGDKSESSPGKNGKKKNFSKDNKKRGKGGPTGNNFPSTAPPKPKRLKKSPFKNKKVTQKHNDSKAETFGKIPKTDGLENPFGESVVQSKESRERIKKIKEAKSKAERSQKGKGLKMLVKPGGKWFEEVEATKGATSEGESELIQDIKAEMGKLSKEEVAAIRNNATSLYENDVRAYKQACLEGGQKSDFMWMEKMMKIGTLPDKMAAYVVKIQDSPVHNLQHLQNLISMVKVQSKQQCIMAADTLKDLFLEDLLPPERKLQVFDKRGQSLSSATREQLVKWIYEDRLKICFSSFIDALRRMSLDNVDKIRAKAVQIIFQLLNSHPEKEADLLQMLVNKLGDRIKKVASRALFYLSSLLRIHTRMKSVVIEEVERLLFRNNISKRAQYYGMCFLNSISLEDEHPAVACKLIGVFVAFFKGCIKTGDIDSKMMSALLTGVNKSYPLAKRYGFKFAENIDTLYKITHLSNFNISLQALSILFQLTDVETRPSEADRYYRVLYQELLRPEVATTSHSLQFLNLIFKSMKYDNKLNRVKGFCKRLLQICLNVQPNLACAILLLLSEVSKQHPGIIDVGKDQSPETQIDERHSDSEDDESGNQTDIMNLMKVSNIQVDDLNTDHTEVTPVPVLDENDIKEEKVDAIENGPISVVDLNTSGIIEENVEVKTEYKNKLSEYDPTARNPCYCGAEFSLSHEIVTLAEHYHPSVALFAKELMRRNHVVYDGNPLRDFTVTRFLERFAYKNPKKLKTGHRAYQPKGLRNIPVNSVDYLKNEEDKIPVDERFFYRFFKDKKATKQDTKDEEFETDSIGDDEFDELMSNFFKSGKRKGEDDDEDDSDEELDFAANIHQKASGKKRKNAKEEEESNSDDEFENDEEMGDEEDDFGPDDDADEMMDLDDDELDFHDEDGVEVYEEDDFDIPVKTKKMKKGKGIDMFAPAEQFAEMLESNADEGLSGPNTLINRDNADPKQLKWEMDRDRWMKGFKGSSSKTHFKNKGRNKRKNK